MKTSVDFPPLNAACWIDGSEQTTWYSTSIHAGDREGGLVVLFNIPIEVDYVAHNRPDLALKTLDQHGLASFRGCQAYT